MPKCKNCGAQLSRLDKDICPFCGARNPLEGVVDETVDITKAFDPVEVEADIKPFSKKKYFILGFLLGMFGIHNIYIKKWLSFIACIAETIVLVAGFGTIFYFTTPLKGFSYLILGGFTFILNAVYLSTKLTKHDLKDGRGEFLR